MSELLASVKSSFFHDVLGVSDTEARLEGREGAYLLRESDVKPSMFILSYVKSSAVSHILIPNRNGKYIRQTLEDAVEMTADIIAASDIYTSFVPPPIPPQDTSAGETHDFDANKCYCCNFKSNNKRNLESHHKCHKVIKCAECSKYVKSGSYTSHKRYCTDTPEKLSCAVCVFETVQRSVMWAHRKNHIARPFLCREGDCRKCFKSEDELNIHQKMHLDKGYKCEHCDKVFKHRYDKARHVHSIHLYAKRRCSIGWFRQVTDETVKKKAQGRTMLSCKVDGCSFKTRWSETERMARHVAAKHPVSPRPKKPHECSECKMAFAFPYLLHKHQNTCKLARANTKRVVKMVSNKSLVAIKKKYPGVTKSAFCGIFKDFSKANPEIIFEGNFRQALDDSINELKKLFSAELLNVQDSKGLELATVVVLVKDLHVIIREYIRRFGIVSPRICLGMDGGNGKFLVTLAMLDMASLGPDICSFSRNGRRRSLIVAASNRCKETKKNLTNVLDRLFLVKLEYPTVFPMDLLCGNLFMGIGRHTSYCPCLYCEGYKLAEDLVTWTTEKALYWVQDATRRTMKRIRELRARWEAKWKGRRGGLNSKAAKDDIKNFASVVDWPIELPEAMLEMLVLLVIPPDPMHVVLIGRLFN